MMRKKMKTKTRKKEKQGNLVSVLFCLFSLIFYGLFGDTKSFGSLGVRTSPGDEFRFILKQAISYSYCFQVDFFCSLVLFLLLF